LDSRVVVFEQPIALDPGLHEIVVEAPGYPRQRIAIQMKERQLVEKYFVLAGDAAPKSTYEKGAGTQVSRQLSLPFYISLGAGIAGLLTAVESGALIAVDRARVEDQCVEKSCSPAGLAAGHRGRALTTINTVAWPVALAGGSAAIYFALRRSSYGLNLTVAPRQVGLILETVVQ
jgi:hypothetical protein